MNETTKQVYLALVILNDGTGVALTDICSETNIFVADVIRALQELIETWAWVERVGQKFYIRKPQVDKARTRDLTKRRVDTFV